MNASRSEKMDHFDFADTPTKPGGNISPHAASNSYQGQTAARPMQTAPSPAPSSTLQAETQAESASMQHAAPAAPAATPASGLPALTARWAGLSSAMKGHSQKAAELLMHQAATTAQVEDVVRQLMWEVKRLEEERQQLEAQILQDRADFTSQAKLLSQHFTLAHHRNTALQVAHEAQSGELKSARDEKEAVLQEAQTLRQQRDALANELAQERQLRAQAEAALKEHGVAIEDMNQELQHSRSCCEELHSAKAQLQAQVKAMVRAEKELTENLKHTHQQIDEQLNVLREQLQAERHKRVAANRRKAELAQHVAVLSDQLESYKVALEEAQQAVESPMHSPSASRMNAPTVRAAMIHSLKLPPSLRSSTLRRKVAPIRVALGAGGQVARPKPPARYTAAFAPPAAIKSARPVTDSSRTHPPAATPSPPPSSRSPLAAFTSPAPTSQHPIKLTSIHVLQDDAKTPLPAAAPFAPSPLSSG